MLAYEHFLGDPQPAARWVLGAGKKLARSHPGWRPFAGLGRRRARAPGHGHPQCLFCVAHGSRYLSGNLAFAGAAPARADAGQITRYLSHALWDAVKEAIEAMPTGTERECLHAARCRWLCTVLYLAGLRASEVAGTTMGAFFSRRDAQGTERWWLEVVGKGSKPRLVPATDELVAELARYRRAHGLPPTPQSGEDRPLVSSR
ncbi:hypothetical protein ACTMU2_16775 [Cupriavidus basilensis]